MANGRSKDCVGSAEPAFRLGGCVSESLQHARLPGRATFSDAMRAWFAGDYEHCLALCDLVERRLAPLAVDVCLLRARVLLRLGRAGDALRAVERALGPVGLLDASLTARMLQGTALVRLGKIDDGLVILDAAQADAAAGGAHPTIRSEIALNRGLAYYGLRDLGAAEDALRGVAGDADIIRATALSYEGWIAAARGDYPAAIERFVSSLHHLDTCRRYDRGLEANCLQALSAFAVERLDRALWQFVAARTERMKWGYIGLAEARFWITMASGYMEELEGRGPGRGAGRAAGRGARAVRGLPGAGAPAAGRDLAPAGRDRHPVDHVTSARELFARLCPEALTGDERNVALTLAEELAHAGAPAEARQALATYRSHPVSAMLSSKNDRRMQAYERLVEGHIAEAAGERVEAHHAYRDAFQVFRATGYRRRALVAALRLAEIAEQPYLYDYVATELTEFSPALVVPAQRRARSGRGGDDLGAQPAQGGLDRAVAGAGDHRPLRAGPHRADGGPHLGDHALGQGAVGQQLLGLGHAQARDHRGRVAQVAPHPGHVGDDHVGVGPQRAGDRAGRGVGVAVQRAAARHVEGQRRDDRHEAGLEQGPRQGRVDALDLADVAQVDPVDRARSGARPAAARPRPRFPPPAPRAR